MFIGISLALTQGTGGGVPFGAIFLNGKPITLNGKYITL